MDDSQKFIALLEEIAFNTSSKILERDVYLARIYALSEPKPTAVHGDVRTQSAARQGEVPKHVEVETSRVRGNPHQGPSREKGKP